jgi:hypothetical protein
VAAKCWVAADAFSCRRFARASGFSVWMGASNLEQALCAGGCTESEADRMREICDGASSVIIRESSTWGKLTASLFSPDGVAFT